MREAWIVDAVRTPIGRHGGVLAPVRPDDLAAVTVRALLDRTSFPANRLDDVILGCTNQAGEDNRNVARMALLGAGLPVEVPGQTVNRLCGSGLQAVASAYHAIRAGEGDAFIAGGVESMSRAPFVMLKPERGYTRGAPEVADTVLGWRFTNPGLPDEWTIGLGQTAEVVAREFGVTREEQDAFAADSQTKAAAAIEAGRFDDEIVPVTVPQRRGDPVVARRDEHPRPGTTAEALAQLRPVFARDGTVTAGNSSGINDGAAALLVVEAETARAHGLEPMAAIRGAAVAGVEPHRMGIGPVPATSAAWHASGSPHATSTWSNSTKPSPRRRSPASANSGWTPGASTSTAARLRSATRWAAPARASWPRWCTKWRAATRGSAWPRCASGWVRGSRPWWRGAEAVAIAMRAPTVPHGRAGARG